MKRNLRTVPKVFEVAELALVKIAAGGGNMWALQCPLSGLG